MGPSLMGRPGSARFLVAQRGPRRAPDGRTPCHPPGCGCRKRARAPPPGYRPSLRSRSALPMTDTDERLIAAAASMGLSSHPKKGYSTPAAMGTPSVL